MLFSQYLDTCVSAYLYQVFFCTMLYVCDKLSVCKFNETGNTRLQIWIGHYIKLISGCKWCKFTSQHTGEAEVDPLHCYRIHNFECLSKMYSQRFNVMTKSQKLCQF